MVEKPVGNIGLAGPAEADQVRGDAMGDRCNERQDVAPDIGRGGVAVQEQGGRCVRRSRLPIGHRRSQQGLVANADIGVLDHDDSSLNTV